MRIHCTKKMLDLIKKDDVIKKDDTLSLDPTYKFDLNEDQLFDWHANIIELSKASCLVVLVNDLTKYAIVTGPVRSKKISTFIPEFKSILKEKMSHYDIPHSDIDQYIQEAEELLFTKSLGPKKIGPLNATVKDVEHYIYYEDLSLSKIDSRSLTEWVNNMIRVKGKDYFLPIDKWLEEWGNRTNTTLVQPYQLKNRVGQSVHLENNNHLPVSGVKNNTAVLQDDWTRIYKKSEFFKASEPWEVISDTELILIEHPETKEIAYCSVLGAMGDFFALAIYIGYEGLLNFHKIASNDFAIPTHQLLHAQECLMISFEDYHDLDEINKEHLKSFSLSFNGFKQWPEVRKFEPGYYPWFSLNEEEVKWLELALDQVPEALRDLKKGNTAVDFKKGINPIRVMNKNSGNWETQSTRLPALNDSSNNKKAIKITDELAVRRLKSAPTVIESIQLDVLYSPAPVQENEDERPSFPRLILVVDGNTGRAVHQDLYESIEDDPERVINTLQLLCEQSKPANIKVRRGTIEWIVEDFCHKVGIELIIEKELNYIDAIMDELAQSL